MNARSKIRLSAWVPAFTVALAHARRVSPVAGAGSVERQRVRGVLQGNQQLEQRRV